MTVCRGLISGLRVSRPGDFLSYARLVQSETTRQGISQTSVTHSISGQDLALATTVWRQGGVVTQYELAAVGNAGASVEMIALEYKTDPNPCPRAE
ncbi:MAG: hypothetical protein U1C74_18560 [Phenylobacterium sp.]|nr:hypothetical protein [Phenylobacterium sp.]